MVHNKSTKPFQNPGKGSLLIVGPILWNDFLLAFYIFKGGKLQQDYIKDCKPSTFYGNVKEGLDDSLFVQRISKLFQKVSS